MSSSTPAMIVSGIPYAVTDVEGAEPSGLDDFTGEVTMHAHGPTGDHEIFGSGEHEHHGAVRVHEKHNHGTGKDVRVWTVSAEPGGEGFVAAG